MIYNSEIIIMYTIGSFKSHTDADNTKMGVWWRKPKNERYASDTTYIPYPHTTTEVSVIRPRTRKLWNPSLETYPSSRTDS